MVFIWPELPRHASQLLEPSTTHCQFNPDNTPTTMADSVSSMYARLLMEYLLALAIAYFENRYVVPYSAPPSPLMSVRGTLNNKGRNYATTWKAARLIL